MYLDLDVQLSERCALLLYDHQLLKHKDFLAPEKANKTKMQINIPYFPNGTNKISKFKYQFLLHMTGKKSHLLSFKQLMF